MESESVPSANSGDGHRFYMAEHVGIGRDLLKWAVPTVGGAIVTGVFSRIISGGLAVASLGEIIQAEMKRREPRKKVPMSVFIDLESKWPS